MKILMKYILNSIRESKFRTAVMVLSIILSTTLLFVSLSIGDSYERAQQKMAKGFAGAATVTVSAKPGVNGSIVWMDEEEIPDIGSIKNKVGLLITSALYSNDGFYENFDLIAYHVEDLKETGRLVLLNDASLTDFSGSSIIVTEKFANSYGLIPGDQIVLSICGVEYQFTLTAIAAYDTVFLRQTRGYNALVPKETLDEILHTAGGFSKIMIEPCDGINSAQLRADLASVLQNDRYIVTKVYDEDQVVSDARQKSLPFYLISFFSFVMSIFIIYSSYKVITIERLPVIGTFRSMGATKLKTTVILLFESLFYGIMGGLLAIPIGFAVLKLILNGLGKSLSLGIEIPMVVKPLNMLVACTVAVFVSLLSAYIPVRKVSKLPVKEVVLGKVEEKRTSDKAKMIVGGILFILSVTLPMLVEKDSKYLLVSGGFSLLGLITATIILTPLIASGLLRILRPVYGKVFGNEGKLSAINMKNNKYINQNIILLFISISSVIVICTIADFAVSYLGDVYGGGNLDGFASGDMSPQFVQTVSEYDGIEECIPIYEMNHMITANSEFIERMEAVDDLSTLCSLMNVKLLDSHTAEQTITSFHNGRNVLFSKEYLKQHELYIGDQVKLLYDGNEYDYTIVGGYESRGDNSDAIIPGEYARTDFHALNFGKLAFSASDPDSVMAKIRNLFGSKYNWSRTVAEYSKDATKIISSFMDPMKKLTYFILLLATVGIVNNLLINYLQKRHTIAMYKSIGMSEKQSRKMSIIEGLTSGMIGSAIGIFISYMEIKTIFIVAGPRIAVTPSIPINIFIFAGISGVVITLTGSIVPILKESKLNLVEEIKQI